MVLPFVVCLAILGLALSFPPLARLSPRLRLFETPEVAEKFKRLIKSQTDLATSQKELGKYIRKLVQSQMESQKELKESQIKTEKQLLQLIGYNKNRDEELEDAVENALFRKLLESGWNVKVVGTTEVFRKGGRPFLEWDGVLAAENLASSKKVLFVIETKQIFSRKKFNTFVKRFHSMKYAMDPKHLMDDNWRPFVDYELCGVIGSPMISTDLGDHNFSVVTSTNDQFFVKLAI